MIWQAWAVLVLVGSGSAYLAFVPREGTPFTSLLSLGAFAVAGFGSLDLVVADAAGSSPYHATETGIAILCFTVALVSLLVTLTSVAEQWGEAHEQDEQQAPAGGRLRRHMEE